MVSAAGSLAGGAISSGVGIAAALGVFGQPNVADPASYFASATQQGQQGAIYDAKTNASLDPFINAYQQAIAQGNLFGAAATPATTSAGIKIPAAPAVMGEIPMLQQAMPELQALQNQSNQSAAAQRASELSTFGPQAMSLVTGVNPAELSQITNLDAGLDTAANAQLAAAGPQQAQETALLSALATQAGQQLATNGGLTAAQQQQYTQQINAANAARGLDVGAGAAAQQANYVFQNQQALRQQNQQLASSVAGQLGGAVSGATGLAGSVSGQQASQLSQLYTDPFLSVLGGITGMQGLATPGVAVNTGPTALSTTAGQTLANSLYGSQYNAQNAANNAGYNTTIQGAGAIGASGSSLGSGLSNSGLNFGASGLFSGGSTPASIPTTAASMYF